jgi:hypothetical protein
MNQIKNAKIGIVITVHIANTIFVAELFDFDLSSPEEDDKVSLVDGLCGASTLLDSAVEAPFVSVLKEGAGTLVVRGAVVDWGVRAGLACKCDCAKSPFTCFASYQSCKSSRRTLSVGLRRPVVASCFRAAGSMGRRVGRRRGRTTSPWEKEGVGCQVSGVRREGHPVPPRGSV